MIVISFVNRKGGISKTTSCISIGGELARRNVRTLLVDFDPQASLTDGLGVVPRGPDAAALFVDYARPAEIVETRFPNLWALPASPALDSFNLPEPRGNLGLGGFGLFALRDFLTDTGDRFQRVLIDCPPNLYCLSLAAMTAAQFVLTPTKSDPDGAASLKFVNQAVASIQAGPNPELRHLGYLLGQHKPRNAIHAAFALGLRQEWPGLLLEEFIPEAAAFVEARRVQAPIAFHKPKSAAAKAVASVVDEVERRIAGAHAREAA